MVSKKIQSIELGRVIAILAIAAMHCQMFLTYWQFDENPWIGYVFNQSTRFAVPLFFLISGYLIQPKLVAAPLETLQRYVSPLLRVFIVWSVITLVMPFNLGTVVESGYLAERQGYWGYLAQSPLNSLLEGGLVHQWFIPALICAAAIAALLLAFTGMALHFFEAWQLTCFEQPFNANDYLFGTFVWGTGCFMWLLAKPNFGTGRWLTAQSNSVLPLYVAHLPMIIVMMNIAGMLALTGFAKDMLLLFGATVLTFLLVKGLERTPLYRFLFR